MAGSGKKRKGRTTKRGQVNEDKDNSDSAL